MPKPPPPDGPTPLTPHVVITSPSDGTFFNGGSNPDTIVVTGTVFLTCDDPGGSCAPGNISQVTVQLGGSTPLQATLNLDSIPAGGTEESGSWSFTGAPQPGAVGDLSITATLTALTGVKPHQRVETTGASVTVFLRPSPPPPPEDTILNLQWANRPFDTSDPNWPSSLFHGQQFFQDESPVWEWMPVLHPTTEVETPPVGCSGTAVRPRLSNEGSAGDMPFTHMFGNDWTVDLVLDQRYRNLLAIGNTNSHSLLRQDPDAGESIRIAKEVLGIDPATDYGPAVKGTLHCEIDRGLIPRPFRALQGDRVAILGRWVVDVGHNNPYGAEIHPPLLLACARPVSASETFVSLVCRPYLSSQQFGSGGLLSQFYREVAAVFHDPFKDRMAARPNPPYTTPFSGIVLAQFNIRPPTPPPAGAALTLDFHFTTRPGVVVQVAPTADAALVIVTMNDVLYTPASLPARHDRFVNPKDLAAAQPGFGTVLAGLEAGGSIDPVNPLAAAVFAADYVTDTYDTPQAVSPADSDIHSLPLPSQHFSEDASQPFPLYGWIRARWTGAPAVSWRPDWAGVPAGVATDTAIAAASYGGRLFAFAKGLDDRIYTSILDEAAPASWGGWHEVAGGGTTDVAPAAATGVDEQVYLFGKGINDRQIYLNVLRVDAVDPSVFRENWTGWSAVPGGGTTDAALCATAYAGRLLLFAKGIDRAIYVNSLDSSGSWSGWSAVPGGGTTDAGLTSAVGIDSRLYLFAKGIDRRIYMNVMDLSGAWSGWQEVPGGGTTDTALRVTRYGARLFLFGKGIDDKIYVNMMEPAGTWSGWAGLPGDVTTVTSITPAEGPDGLLYAFAVTPQQQIVYTTNSNA